MGDLIRLDQIQIEPSDFAAWRDEIDMCACEMCQAANANRVLDHFGYQRLIACVALLEHLKAGRHVRRTYAQAATDARAKTIANGAYGHTIHKGSLASFEGQPWMRSTWGGLP